MKFFYLSIFLFAVLQPLSAEVYLLRDLFRKSKTTNAQTSDGSFAESQLRDIMRFKPLFSENIIINGEKGSLDVGLLDFSYTDFMRFLERIRLKNAAANNQNCTLIFNNKRYLIYNIGDFSKALCFEFNVVYRKNPPSLPHYIPNPGSGSVHTKIVVFPKRNATYVTFDSVLNAQDAFYNCEGQLKSRGILRVGGTGDSSSAGFFMNSSGSKIVLVSFNEKYHNGFIYHTERKK